MTEPEITYETLAQEARTRWPTLDPARLEKAVRLAQAGKVAPGPKLNTAEVQSEHGSQVYHVDTFLHTCNCPDAIHRHGMVCAHRLAVWLKTEFARRNGYHPSEGAQRAIKELGY